MDCKLFLLRNPVSVRLAFHKRGTITANQEKSMAYPFSANAGAERLSRASGLAYAPAMQADPSDRALMSRYRDGDVTAFELLYRRHKDPLYRYLLRQCRNPAAAEDVFQEVWSRIIRARATYRPSARFATYLYHVAHNCFIDHLRRNGRHQAATAAADPDELPHGGDLPEQLTERQLARERLRKALTDLPPEQREAFLLREEAGLSLEEIASVTGVKAETAKSRLRYATRKLRAAIDACAEER